MVWDNAWVSSFQISHASDCYSNFLRERTSELTSDQTNEWTSHGRKDERTNKRANGRTNRRTDGRTNERTNERTSKGANERVNKWKNQRMNEYVKKHSTHVPLSSKAHLHFVSPFLYLNFSSTAGFYSTKEMLYLALVKEKVKGDSGTSTVVPKGSISLLVVS